MAKNIFFRQCELAKYVKDGKEFQVAWIPESKATIGKVLDLDIKETGLISRGWVVVSVGAKRNL